MNLHRNERGQMLVMTAIELTMLLGFLALAADVGVLFHSKRHMQAAADAAATAGALNDYNVSLGYIAQTDTTAARNAAAANGYTNGQDGVVVKVNIGRDGQIADGYHTGAGYVEVIISKPDPLYFFKVFTGNGTATVAARAVAGDPEGQLGCINVNHLYLKGSATIQGQGGGLACGINVLDSVDNHDAGSVVKADYLHTPSGASEGKPTSPTPTTKGYDPNQENFATREYPNPWDSATGPNGTTTRLCNSGNTYTAPTYNTGLATDGTLPQGQTETVAGTLIYNVVCFGNSYPATLPQNMPAPLSPVQIGSNSQSSTTFPYGFYIFENGANFNGTITFGQDPNINACSTATSGDDGAVIYNYAGALVQSNGQLGVCGPRDKTYEYNSIAIMQPSFGTNPAPDLNPLDLQFGMSGNAGTDCAIGNASLNGYVVAPSATVKLHDQGGGVMATGIVADELEIDSSTLSICNYNQVNPDTTSFKTIALVE